MRRLSAIFLFFSVLSLPLPGAEMLTIYSYDAFSSQGGLGEWLQKAFEKKTSIKTRFVPFASAGEALNQVAIEGKATPADLVVGIDNNLAAGAESRGLFVAPGKELFAEIPNDLTDLLGASRLFVPFDYGYLAFNYDSRRTTPPRGVSLREFVRRPALVRRIVLEDPRTSSLGSSFLVWTKSAYAGKEWEAFWKDLSRTLVTLSPGWTGAYGLFLKKEADYVLSYSTSPAYHREKEHLDAFRFVNFPEGHFRQVEGVGIVKSSKHLDAARRWIAFLLEPESQKALPLRQWMYPARKVELPGSFRELVIPKAIDIPAPKAGALREEALKDWKRVMMKP